MEYLLFHDWHLSQMFSKIVQVEAFICILFLLLLKNICVDIPHFIYAFIDGYLGCFYSLAVLNMLLRTFLYKCFCGHMFTYIMELFGYIVIIFNLLNCPLLYRAALPFYISTSKEYENCNFSRSWLTLVTVLFSLL